MGKPQGNRIHHGDGFTQQGLPGNAPLGVHPLLPGIIQERAAEGPGRHGVPLEGQAGLRPGFQGAGIIPLPVDKQSGCTLVRQVILKFPVQGGLAEIAPLPVADGEEFPADRQESDREAPPEIWPSTELGPIFSPRWM